MQTNTKSFGSRVLAMFLAIACVFMLISQTAPSAWAEESTARPENIKLTYVTDGNSYVTLSGDGKSATYTYPASQTTAEVRMKLKVALNKDYAENQLRIEIPYAAFTNRDGKPLEMDNTTAVALRNQINSPTSMLKLIEDPIPYKSEYDKFAFTNKASDALQLEIDLLYKMSTWDLPDGTEQEFNIKITDTATGEDLSPEPLKTTILTTVDKVRVYKDVDTSRIEDGMIDSWSTLLESRYKLETNGLYTPESFNAECETYSFMSYMLTAYPTANQRYDIYVKDTPHIERGEGDSVETIDDGEVIAVSYPNPTWMSCKAAEKVEGGDHDGEYLIPAETGSTQYIFVLVKYKKSNIANGENIINNATVTVEGLDRNQDDTASNDASCSSQWHWASAIKPGDIWSVTKKGYKSPTAGIDLLKKGKDVVLKYDISGIGLTYKYGMVDNFQYSNGPYTLELIDDLLYTTGLGQSGGDIERLGPDDFYFKSFTLSVKHSVVESAYPNKEVETYHALPRNERPDVTVYVMKASNPGVWVEDQVITNEHCYVSRSDSKDCQYYHNVNAETRDTEENKTFVLNNTDAYRIKFVYPNANGDIELKSTVTGVVRAEGTTIKKVLKNLEDNKLNTFQIFNWDGANGYRNGTDMIWDNPSDGEDIRSSSEFMKEDVKIFDAENYDGHVYNDNVKLITKRLVASNTFSQISTYAGAGKSSQYSQSNGRISLTYNVGAVIGESSTEEGLRDLVEVGLIDSPKKFVFYDLLPSGVQLNKVTYNSYFDLYNLHKNYNWKSGHYNNSFTAVDKNNIPTITTDVIDNYKGTLRQMVKVTVEYDELPIATLGWTGNPDYYSYVLASGVTISAIGEYSDITSGNLENQMVAQVFDDKGQPIKFDVDTAYPDDGSIFETVKDRDGNNAFSDVDGDGDTTSKTTLASSISDTVNIVYTATTLIKKIKADGLDNYFKDYTQTYADHDYTYKLQFTTHEGQVRNIVIFDAIEMAYRELDPAPDFWKGTLTGINIKEAQDNGFDKIRIFVNTQKAYTNKEMATSFAEGYAGLTPADLTAANGWTEVTDPDNYKDWSKVKTIAFSFGEDTYFGSEGELDPNGKPMKQTVSVYLKMHAPAGISPKQTKDSQILAYNNPAYFSEVVDLDGSVSRKTSYSNTVTIGVKSANLEIPAVSKSVTGNLPSSFNESFEFEITPENNSPVLREMNNGSWGSEINGFNINITKAKPTATVQDSRKAFVTEPTYVYEANSKGEVTQVLINEAPYSYIITEKQGNVKNINYSKAKYRVEYTVSDNRTEVPQYANDTELKVAAKIYKLTEDDGTELAEAVEVKSVSFKNEYTVEPIDVPLPVVVKEFDGDERPNEKDFTFMVVPYGSQTYPIPRNNTVTITGPGSAEFDKIRFTEAGTYSYLVGEVGFDKPEAGYTYSKVLYGIMIVIVNNDGKLEVDSEHSALYINPDYSADYNNFLNYDGTQLLYKNTYTVTPTEAIKIPDVSKKILGADRPSEKEFTFGIRASEKNADAPLPQTTTVTIRGEGTEEFPEGIVFTKAGTYVYEIYEYDMTDEQKGYTGDDTVYYFTVKVTDNESVLTAEAKITDNSDEAVDKAEFTNTYSPLPCKKDIEIAKQVFGTPEKTATYAFELTSGEGDDAKSIVKTIEGTGTLTFDEIEYTEAGKYTYTLKEIPGDDPTCLYDKTVYTIVDTVTDEDGQLTVSRSITTSKGNEDEIRFRNTYDNYNSGSGDGDDGGNSTDGDDGDHGGNTPGGNTPGDNTPGDNTPATGSLALKVTPALIGIVFLFAAKKNGKNEEENE